MRRFRFLFLLPLVVLAACTEVNITGPLEPKPVVEKIHLPPFNPPVWTGIGVGINYGASITFFAPIGVTPELVPSSSSPHRLVVLPTAEPVKVAGGCASPCDKQGWLYLLQFRAEVPLDEVITISVKNQQSEKITLQVIADGKG